MRILLHGSFFTVDHGLLCLLLVVYLGGRYFSVWLFVLGVLCDYYRCVVTCCCFCVFFACCFYHFRGSLLCRFL